MINPELLKLSRPVQEVILGPDQIRALHGLPATAEVTFAELPDGSPGVCIRWREEPTPGPAPASTGAIPDAKKAPGKERATPAPRPPQDDAP